MNGLFLRGFRINWSLIPEDDYLRDIGTVRKLDGLIFQKPVTIFTGENGTGKSTILEALAVAAGFNPEGGSRNYRFSTYDSHSSLCDAIRLIRGSRREVWGYFLRAESFYNVATKETDYARPGDELLHEKSHGESFLSVVQRYIQPNGLYLLDEPEAALSPQMQLTVLAEIWECAQRGAQFIIATHSPVLLGIPDAEILSFDGGEIHPCAYENTQVYRIVKMFVTDRGRILKDLLEE